MMIIIQWEQMEIKLLYAMWQYIHKPSSSDDQVD